MQKKESIPTPLLHSESRKPVEIVALTRPNQLRLVRVVAFIVGAVRLWWTASLSLLFTGRSDTGAGARRIRKFLEEMGGMWIKAGQIVSLRRDLFRKETCDEFSKLQDHARGFPFDYVRRVIEEDLGSPIEEVFSEFCEAPVAAASIGQTHEARLRHNGARVAVKVQRPYVAESFRRDLRYLRFVTSALQRFRVAPHARWDEMMWELEKTLTEELDYRMEASSIARMRKKLRRHKVYAPKVFSRYCSRRLLVMEFVDGVFMSTYMKASAEDPARVRRWTEENHVNPVKVGEQLYISHLRQLAEDNLFHCDLHPGNIVLLRDSKFALIDFGSVATLEQTRLKKFRILFNALSQGDYGKYVDVLLLQGPPLPNGVDIDAVKTEMVRAIRKWETLTKIKNLPYHEKSISTMYQDTSQILSKFGVGIAWDFLSLTRADLTLDSSLALLCPKVDFLKLNRRYQREAKGRAMRRSARQNTLMQTIAQLTALAEVPATFGENIILEGDWLRKRAMGFEGKVNSIALMIKSVLSVLALAALGTLGIAVGSYIRLRRDPEALRASWVGPLFEHLPPLRAELWILVACFAVYLFSKLTRIRSFVQETEYDNVRGARR